MFVFTAISAAFAWVMKNLMIIAVAAGVLLVSNLLTGWVSYVRGYNSAATQCKLNTVIRERDEARRDLKIAEDTGATLKAELKRQQTELAKSDKEVADYAERLRTSEQRIADAEAKAAGSRPSTCPACPRPRPCVVD